MVLLEAAVRLAADAGDLALELRARNNLAALLGQDDGNEGMRVAREAYELSTRLGVRQLSQWIMGAIAYGAVYEGLDWDTALDGLAVEVEASQSEADRARLLGVRSAILVWRGDDPAEILQEYAEWAASVSDPDFQAWQIMQPATAALVGGQPRGCHPALP